MSYLTSYRYQVGGSLPMHAPTYVVRQADKDLYQGLKSGEFYYVLNSRQMGKSSLRVQAMAKLQAEGTRCAEIDTTLIGSEQVTPEEWYSGIVSCLVSEFGLKINGGAWWRDRSHLSPVQRLSQFIDEILLVELSQNIVIFVDEIDSVLSLDFLTDDFFGLIRACYNQRTKKPAYNRLTFALLGVATPSNLIQDKNRTPFNIGRSIQLNGFQLGEAEPLRQGLVGRVSDPDAALKQVLAWTGGQPFLTQKLCQLIWTRSPLPTGGEAKWVADLVDSQVIQNWEAQDEPEHLRTIRDRLLRNEQRAVRLLGLYRQILQQGEIAADGSPGQIELRLSGLVVDQQGRLTVYNRIYHAVFSLNWVDQELANLRPYAEAIDAWVTANCQDESWLLRGQGLQDALAWASGKSLSDSDHRFLADSQDLSRREVQAALEAEIETAKQILARAQRKAKREIRIGATILAMSLVGAVTAVGVASRALRIEQIDTLNSTSETLRSSNRLPEALTGSVKAGQQLQQNMFGVPNNLKDKTERTLQRVIDTIQSRLVGHKDEVYSVNFSPDGRTLASASEDKTVRLWSWDSKEGKAIKTLKGHDEQVRSVSFSPNGQLLASASEDKTVRLWNAEGKAIKTLKGHSEPVFSVSFSLDGQTIASVGSDRQVILWNLDGEKINQWNSGHTKNVVDVAFSPEGVIATASDDGTAKLWNQQGSLLETLKGHSDEVNGVSFGPDGVIATASDDRTAKLWSWDGKSGKAIKTLKGHSERVMSISFSPNRQTIATAGFDRVVKLWKLDGTPLATLQGHDDWVWEAIFSPNGETLASASRDRTIRLWHLGSKQPSPKLDKLLERGCQWLRGYWKTNPTNMQESDPTALTQESGRAASRNENHRICHGL